MEEVPAQEPVSEEPAPEPAEIVDVRFRVAGRTRAYHVGDLDIRAHQPVIVESDRGPELGEVLRAPRPRWNEEVGAKLPRVLRLADDKDLERASHNRDQEQEAARVFLDTTKQLGLALKLIRADYRFDGGKAVFYFMSEKRVDFRGLVRDLAQRLHTRVEMRQIGARDETRLIGGLGPCGRELCCSSWLREFGAVSVKMAKAQDLSLNPSKLAGMCGRLKCCLRYEYETYVEMKRGLPKVGRKVQTIHGRGEVVKVITLKESVLVRRDEDEVLVECTREDLVERRPDDKAAPGPESDAVARSEVTTAGAEPAMDAGESTTAATDAPTPSPTSEATAPARDGESERGRGRRNDGEGRERRRRGDRRRRRSASGTSEEKAGESGDATSTGGSEGRSGGPKRRSRRGPKGGAKAGPRGSGSGGRGRRNQETKSESPSSSKSRSRSRSNRNEPRKPGPRDPDPKS